MLAFLFSVRDLEEIPCGNGNRIKKATRGGFGRSQTIDTICRRM